LAKAGVRLVSGTTGLGDEHRRALADAARLVAVLWEPNMSLGVHVLGRMVEQAVRALGPAYDVEIVETHHRMKVDAPGGTAMLLAQKAKAARDGATHFVYGREGRPGARKASDVGVLAVRGGDVIGDHTVHLMGIGERLELTHRATHRDVFAEGALRAAQWLATKPAGTYSLGDIIG
jgi:4-hydroxy-tetrahydrodipicolinate reductase